MRQVNGRPIVAGAVTGNLTMSFASPRSADSKAYNARRGSAHERGYTSAWQRARAAYLRAHPLCADHERRGQLVAAAVVDHKVAPRLKDAVDSGDAERIASARALFWDRDNWQGLCKSCHDSAKQRAEKSGQLPGCDVDGRPLDPSHHWHARGQGG